MPGDVLVGYIGAAVNLDRGDQWVARRGLKPLIGYQNSFDSKAPGSPEDQLLYIAGRRVGIYPDFQRSSLSCRDIMQCLGHDHGRSGSGGRCASSCRIRSFGFVPSSLPVGLT